MNRKTYSVTTNHPAGYMNGTHELTVAINKDGTRYVSGRGFGCSRDYVADGDRLAINRFMAENGMVATSISSVTL